MKTPKGWRELIKKPEVEPTTNMNVLNHWVNQKTGDSVIVFKKNRLEKPYILHTAPEGKLHNYPDTFYSSLTKVREDAIKLMKKV